VVATELPSTARTANVRNPSAWEVIAEPLVQAVTLPPLMLHWKLL
jgi:hypothetical protein